MSTWVGADVGGTFTDFVVFDDAKARLEVFKVPSTPSQPADAVVEGFRRLIASGIDPSGIVLVCHASTVALNTVVQRTGARVGLVTTKGFRDVLSLRRLRLAGAPSFAVNRSEPLVSRRDIAEIDGRLLADGTEIRPLDQSAVARAVGDLVAAGCESIAICLLHSYRSACHEKRVAEAVTRAHPQIHLSVSSDLWPQQREYERTEVTVINAHIAPAMSRYFNRLRSSLECLGVRAPLLVTKSSGGAVGASEAEARPVETLLSGPAGGVVASARLGNKAGYDRLCAVDMGGTSADSGLVIDGAVQTTTEAAVGEFPVIIPAVDVSSIGAGGGSIARVDRAGVLKVGPRSAGAVPGPTCYGRGGEEPTITDAYATLGIVTHLLGGEIELDVEAARFVCEKVGRLLGLEPEAAAEAILDVATANMYAHLMPLMAKRGADPHELALLCYGGAGPTHAFRIAEAIGFSDVVIPPSPGTFCALGCLLADLRADFVTSVYADIEHLGADGLSACFSELQQRAASWLAAQNLAAGEAGISLSADMRRAGQSYEISVELGSDVGPDFDRLARQAFFDTYRQIYGDGDQAGGVELVNARARAIAPTPSPSLSPVAPTSAGTQKVRRVYHRGRRFEADVVRRASLAEGARLAGPAIVWEYDTTTFVSPDACVAVDHVGNLVGGIVSG